MIYIIVNLIIEELGIRSTEDILHYSLVQELISL